MKDLRNQRCWCVWDGNRKEYIGPNGAPALADNVDTLTDYAEAMETLYRLADGQWPAASGAVHLSSRMPQDEQTRYGSVTNRPIMQSGKQKISSTMKRIQPVCEIWDTVLGGSEV